MAKIQAEKEPSPQGHTYESYKDLIERYAEQNPDKYALKKEALEAKLAALKPKK